MLAVFLAATSFAPGAPLRGAVVAPRRAAAPVAALDFDTLHSVTTQIAELVDADGERVYGAVDAPGWVAPVGAVVIAFFTTLLPMCARRATPARAIIAACTSTAHAAASLHSALAPGEEAFQGMQKAEEGRFGAKGGGIQGRGGRRR